MFRTALFTALTALSLVPSLAAADVRDHNAAPTVVLVHGAFADGASWNKVIAILQSWGVRTVATHSPLTSLSDDVQATRRAIDNASGPVVLVGHSWGGTVITQAGTDPRVSALVYVAAFAPDVGQNTGDQGRGFPVPHGLSGLREHDGFLWLNEHTVAEDFAPELKPRDARLIFSTQAPIKASAFGEAVTQAAWRGKPSWYVIARNDRMIAPELQADTARRIGAQVRSIASGHAAPLSQPREVAYAILEAAGVKAEEPAAHAGG
ncbi:alpha/beta fold hydrolase [Pseudomonas sp. CGJS7]|uniref:alpha/beta fold hydrolase n=1 Tax=Pseudomonas sp. CGJS7 TaxID=3109348 RepID=UPI00300A2186